MTGREVGIPQRELYVRVSYQFLQPENITAFHDEMTCERVPTDVSQLTDLPPVFNPAAP